MTPGARPPAPSDQATRVRALDPERSFIVQAPAGSGKTGLLTQRYLALLARVRHPEEIIAITFTRKAAAEMRSRIVDALRCAEEPVSGSDYEHRTQELALAARERARTQGWDLLQNPQRLRIQTIDSLCQFLSRRMPVTSGFGEIPAVAEDADYLYRAAAESVLGELEKDGPVADALAVLLASLDNRIESVTETIAAMLARRDQWLRHILDHGSRPEIERVLENVVERHLERVCAALPENFPARLLPLLRFAAGNLPPDHPLAAFRQPADWPPATAAQLPAWQALADLLLVQSGHWRKSVTVAHGFPAGNGSPEKEMKAAMAGLLEDLRGDDRLRELLQEVRGLPSPSYRDDEWRLLQALFEVLRAALAHLRVIFSEKGRVDFIELSLSAQAALGHELEPTELALRLDYRVQHLLVDEFQDTSQNQYELFRRLTAGWQPNDGRTLFLVGDPMQSIYGFREAEVGLFIDAWQGRLGGVKLEPLRLSVNFRSEKNLVEWVNEVFPLVLPDRADPEKGAVPYAPSQAYRPPCSVPSARVHPFVGRDDGAEAERVLEIVRAGRREGETTAVLVRGKAHLVEIADLLRATGLRYQAVELGALQHRPAVMDLVSLTLALLHPADRVSWLAVLRGPYVGLSPSDLLALAEEEPGKREVTIADRLFDAERLAALSEDGQERLARVIPTFRQAQAECGRRPLWERVEGCWLALGGSLTLVDEASREDVEVCFRLLRELGSTGRPVTPEVVLDGLERLCARPDPLADKSLQLMTIHKAKGLEFDRVIVPGLGKQPRAASARLLYWRESTAGDGMAELLFGTIKPSGDATESATSAYIRRLEAESAALESARLLYVAATRARRELHLLGHARETRAGEVRPEKNSLLAHLWPALGAFWNEAGAPKAEADDAPAAAVPEIPRSTVPADWCMPAPPAMLGAGGAEDAAATGDIPFEWAGETARAVGTVVHRLLQYWAECGLPENAGPWLRRRQEALRHMLQTEGVLAAQLERALQRVERALENVARDPRGRWLWASGHRDVHSEFPVTAVLEGRPRRMVIDRTFIDRDGVRWVIDYKTGVHGGGDVEAFLDREAERYREQLAAYATAMGRLGAQTLRAGLYFPLIEGGWRELELE